MTRSFGDKMGAKAGVIAEPEITEYMISYEDKFIVVASDGVFEYLSDIEVIFNPKIISRS
jgi:serine/threonine protein phosphatase PrpC